MKLNTCFTLFFLCLFITSAVYPQKNWFSGEINLLGMVGSEKELPFWMYSNQRGRITENTNFAGWISGESFFELGRTGSLEAGGGILLNNGFENEIFIDALYATYKNNWLEITAGIKQRPEFYKGLSASNENILWSLNSRPLPGLQLKTNRPVFPFKKEKWGFEGSWEEYLLEEDRYISHTKLHHKKFRLVYRSKSFEIKAGVQHFVQWGGTSQNELNQPESFEDYLRIITAQGGGENANTGDQLNALGNHLGSYEFHFTTIFSNFKAQLIYNHLFDDKSGMRLGNTPDGRYGLFVDYKEKQQWINSFMYEFYYTKHQSHTTSGNHIWDNYLNNFLYRSGWTYKERVIGAPFFIPNYYKEEHSGAFIRIGNNTFLAHHFGLAGRAFKKIPYRLQTSYRRNYGHYRITGDFEFEYYPPDDPRGQFIIPDEVISALLDVMVYEGILDLNILFSADFTSEYTNPGIGVNLQRSF